MSEQEVIDWVFGIGEYEATKKCSKCKEHKHVDQFCKKSSTRDGLQTYCRECSKAQAKEFRQSNPAYYKEWAEVNPEYYAQYHINNPNYYDKLLCNENGYSIYTITNQLGQVYVGVTKYKLNYRFYYHVSLMEALVRKNEKLSPVHNSMYVNGSDNHTIELYRELGHVTKKEAEDMETLVIHEFQKEGYSMLNVNKLKKYE